MASPTFTPDNVLMNKDHEGIFTNAQELSILEDFAEASRLTQLGSYVDMNNQLTKKFVYFAKGPGAYWVSEAEKIKTSKAEWKNATMESHKLGVIIPVTNEFLDFTKPAIFEQLKPKIVEAINGKIDDAVFLGTESPFPKNVLGSVPAANKIEGDITGKNIEELEFLLAEEGINLDAFVSTRKNLRLLNQAYEDVSGAGTNAVANKLYNKTTGTLDGVPVVDMPKNSSMVKGTLIAGDFKDYLYYGIPRGFEYAISEEAQLSTVVDEGGSPINLFEQDMKALRVTFTIGAMVVKDEAFAAIVPKATAPEEPGDGQEAKATAKAKK